MRTWDIVDKLDPNVQITVETKNKARVSGSVSSAVKTVLLLTAALVASSGPNRIQQQGMPACNSYVHLKKGSQSVSAEARRRVARGTDTQQGQSSSKLARSLSTFFQPAQDEEDYDDDYSFA